MTTRDPHTDPLGEALRCLPRHRPGDRFSQGVLDRLGSAETAPRRPAALRSTLRWAAAGLLLGAAVLGGLLLSDGAPTRESSRQARLESLEVERARLAAELTELRRLTDEITQEPAPVLYLGGDEEVDLVLDLGRLAREGHRDPRYRLTSYDQEVDRP